MKFEEIDFSLLELDDDIYEESPPVHEIETFVDDMKVLVTMHTNFYNLVGKYLISGCNQCKYTSDCDYYNKKTTHWYDEYECHIPELCDELFLDILAIRDEIGFKDKDIFVDMFVQGGRLVLDVYGEEVNEVRDGLCEDLYYIAIMSNGKNKLWLPVYKEVSLNRNKDKYL